MVLRVSHDYNKYLLRNFFVKKNIWSHILVKFKMYLELKLYKMFIRKLRRMSKKKKFKSFVFLCCNHCFSKKSKNSRMGKGKGKFVRFVYRVTSMKPVFSFLKISKRRVIKFSNYLNKKSKNNFLAY